MTPHERSERNLSVVAAFLLGLAVGIAATLGGLSGADKLCHSQCVELGDLSTIRAL